MCFIFVAPINVIFMRPLYEADIQCDCIINLFMYNDTKKKRPLYIHVCLFQTNAAILFNYFASITLSFSNAMHQTKVHSMAISTNNNAASNSHSRQSEAEENQFEQLPKMETKSGRKARYRNSDAVSMKYCISGYNFYHFLKHCTSF